MCDGDYEQAQVWCPRWRKARKTHVCCACAEPIRPGDRYHYISYVFDGSAGSYKHCARCWSIYEAICAAYGQDAWEHVELELDCGTLWEREIGPLPDDVAALAFALPGDFAEGRRA